MKMFVDIQRCEGHGLCEEAAPELFRLDDEGDLVVLFNGDDVPPGQDDRAAGAARACPVGALRAGRA
jgi:ferredoxin